MRTKILLRNTSLNIGLTIVVLLKLMLWPLKVTNNLQRTPIHHYHRRVVETEWGRASGG